MPPLVVLLVLVGVTPSRGGSSSSSAAAVLCNNDIRPIAAGQTLWYQKLHNATAACYDLTHLRQQRRYELRLSYPGTVREADLMLVLVLVFLL